MASHAMPCHAMLKGRSKWVWGVGKRVGCTSGHNGWDCNHLMAPGGGGERTEFACAASTEARAAPPRSATVYNQSGGPAGAPAELRRAVAV